MFKGIFGSKGAFKSMTFWGVLGGVFSTVVGHYDPTIAPPVFISGLQIASVAITALGLRRSSVKAVAELSQLVQDLAAKK